MNKAHVIEENLRAPIARSEHSFHNALYRDTFRFRFVVAYQAVAQDRHGHRLHILDIGTELALHQRMALGRYHQILAGPRAKFTSPLFPTIYRVNILRRAGRPRSGFQTKNLSPIPIKIVGFWR